MRIFGFILGECIMHQLVVLEGGAGEGVGGNMVAHSLARYAKNLSNEMYWLEDSPPPAVEALYQDSLHINE